MALLSKTVTSPSWMAGTLPFGLTRQEGGVELLAAARVHRHGLVGQTRLLEEQRDLGRVGREVVVVADHPRRPPSAFGFS